MDEAPQPQRVNSVAHLRYLIGQLQPGEHLYLEIAPNITFNDARTMWEAATLEEGGHALFNPEKLRSKMQASDFVNGKIRELKVYRDYLNGRIGCMSSWCRMMERDLEDGGPHIPASHEPLKMMGPPLYLDLDKIGTVEDFDEHREDILDEYYDMTVPAGFSDLDYWKPAASMWRERQDSRSLIRINLDFLRIKVEGPLLHRQRHQGHGAT